MLRAKHRKMNPKCSVPPPQIRPFQFQNLNGLRQLAETRRFKVPLFFPPLIGFQHFIPTQHANVTHTMQVWLLDQFGVLHDGKQPYPGAISTCKYYYSTLSLFFNLFFFVVLLLRTPSYVMLCLVFS